LGAPRQYRRAEDYIAEPGLVSAVNVALLLDKPLLLTGEPGTGKTQLAYSLAWELGFGDPLAFETKSTSAANDLFYTFDTVGRFKASSQDSDPLKFLTFNAFGRAILCANEPESVENVLSPMLHHGGKRRSVVLIDEVDKASRDFPNDILNELEDLRFAIPELSGITVSAEPDYRPIVVITSNSEKDLPDAFLRRCIYYNVPFPKAEVLREIVTRRLGEFASSSSELLSNALSFFFKLREPGTQLRKNPATAELLDWLITLRGVASPNSTAWSHERVKDTMSALVKTAEDQDRALKVADRWFQPPKDRS
jgi:MoxR-like ATPase